MEMTDLLNSYNEVPLLYMIGFTELQDNGSKYSDSQSACFLDTFYPTASY